MQQLHLREVDISPSSRLQVSSAQVTARGNEKIVKINNSAVSVKAGCCFFVRVALQNELLGQTNLNFNQ